MREVWILRRLRHKGDVEITNEIIGLFWELSDAMEEVGGDEIVKWEEVGESYVYGTYQYKAGDNIIHAEIKILKRLVR
jgi:hypothetical protein